MGLVEFQSALARLYTDSLLRERFYADPSTIGQQLSLTDAETSQIAQLSATQVVVFAASIVAKRRHEVGKLLPLTRRVLARRFQDDFARYAVAPIPEGLDKHRQEAITFATFLEAAGHGLRPAWALDILHYERAWLEAASPGRRWLARHFRYPVGKLAHSLRRGDAPASVPPVKTIGIWFRFAPSGPLRHLLLSFPTVRQK